MNDLTVTSDDIVNQSRRPVPSSDATMVEQSRAIAEVQGALVVAQKFPRDEITAMERMKSACGQPRLAERAFFRFNRGGGQVSGPSIHLATELARCWGNIQYGISELRRDETRKESEMLAFAWDQETNTRNILTFIVPHKRDKKGGPVDLIDMRDIYENNANAGARRLRECIFRVLPVHFREEAQARCLQTLEHGGGEPIEMRRAKMLEAFEAKFGVTREQIEAKIGRRADKLTAAELGTLRVVFESLHRGEATVADEFPVDAAADAKKALEGDEKSAKEPEAPATDPKAKKTDRKFDLVNADGVIVKADITPKKMVEGYLAEIAAITDGDDLEMFIEANKSAVIEIIEGELVSGAAAVLGQADHTARERLAKPVEDEAPADGDMFDGDGPEAGNA